jgi:hypothetical protein
MTLARESGEPAEIKPPNGNFSELRGRSKILAKNSWVSRRNP